MRNFVKVLLVGKLNVLCVLKQKKQTNAELNLNKELANQVIQSLQWIKTQAGEGEINLTDVLRYPGGGGSARARFRCD